MKFNAIREIKKEYARSLIIQKYRELSIWIRELFHWIRELSYWISEFSNSNRELFDLISELNSQLESSLFELLSSLMK